MLQKVILLLTFNFCFIGFSQKNIDPTVTDIELAKSIRGKYEKSDIAILESTENISFDFNKSTSSVTVNLSVDELLMNINHRADIFKYEFYDSSSKIENFEIKYRNDKLASFRIEDEFYKDNDLFYNDARIKHVKIDFPVQGYTYSYHLDKKFEDVKYFTSFYFNDEYPVLKKKVTITVPTWLNVELKEMNFNDFPIVKKQTTDSKKNTTTITYEYNDIPIVLNEIKSPGRSYLYPHVLVIAKSAEINGKKITLFNETADLYAWYRSLTKQLNNSSEPFKAKVSELTANAKTDDEKIKNIYYWVQDNIRYIAFEDGIAGFKPDDAQNVYQKRYGDCKGMANLIKQMLILAGFDARLTWIGTRHIAYNYSIPSLSVDNHMICTVMHNGKQLFLDGTEKNISLTEYAERIQNKEVMIENGEEYIISKVPSVAVTQNKETFRARLIMDGIKLKGDCKQTYLGESRTEFQNIYHSFETNRKQEELEGYLAKNDKNNHVTNIKTSDLKSREEVLTIDYALESENRVSIFDDEIYLNFEFMNEYKKFFFKDRKTDYELDYKTYFDSEITIVLPDGYKIDQLPAPIIDKQDDYQVEISFSLNGNELIYKKLFVFKNAIMRKPQQEIWNTTHKKITDLYNSTLTLVKS
jgi:hypothetical protein